MDDSFIYEQIHAFLARFSYEYREGVTVEVKEILYQLQTGEKVIKDFTLFFDHETCHYRVNVILKENDFSTAHNVFMSFLMSIAYTGANITANQRTEQGMRYILASFDEKGRGFYCEINFLSEKADTRAEEQQRDQKIVPLNTRSMRSNQRQQPPVERKFKMDIASNFPLLAAQGLIYMGGEGDLYAIDAEQGVLRWHWEAEQKCKITALPSIDQGILSVYTSARSQGGTYEATLFALEAQTGRVLWSSSVPALQSIGLCHLLTTQDGIIYLSGTNRNMLPTSPQSLCLAIDLQTGLQKWLVDIDGYLGTTTPVIANTQIYLVTFDIQHRPLLGFLHALDAQTGNEIWQHTFEAHGVQEIATHSTDVFVAGTNLEIIDALTGMIRWSLPNMQAFRGSSLTVSDELIVISYERIDEPGVEKLHESLLAGGPLLTGEIMVIDRASRQPRWAMSLTHGRSYPERPLIAGEVLYTTWKHLDVRGQVTHATLFALDVHTGQECWRFDAADLSAPFAVEGVILIRVQEDQSEYVYTLP